MLGYFDDVCRRTISKVNEAVNEFRFMGMMFSKNGSESVKLKVVIQRRRIKDKWEVNKD